MSSELLAMNEKAISEFRSNEGK
ncbi:MAG: hypothetical protein ACKVKP_04770, partial [Acidimicrobiales bacterium]